MLVSFLLEPFELLQPLDVFTRDVSFRPAKPIRVLTDDWMERIEELPLPKLSAGEGRRSPAPGARRTWRPRQRRGEVDRAAHLTMGRNLDRLHATSGAC